MDLSSAYLNDEDVRLASRSTMALALLPREHVEEAFEAWKETSPTEMTDFFDYCLRQWFIGVSPNYWNVSN